MASNFHHLSDEKIVVIARTVCVCVSNFNSVLRTKKEAGAVSDDLT